MAEITALAEHVKQRFASVIQSINLSHGELTIEVDAKDIHAVCLALRDEPDFEFSLLMDLCGVDYSTYGESEWTTEQATRRGYSRGVRGEGHKVQAAEGEMPRFAVVYHLLSLKHNHRIRLRSFAQGEPPQVDSVLDVWASANWFEREAFDLFGILFNGHPDLRRLLTDYGFVGHPFRKDFPLIGEVEVRYDGKQRRVVYEPVSIEPRTLVPRVIRDDNRYLKTDEEETGASNQ